MEYCSNCGSELDSGAKFCPECGERVADTDAGERAPTQDRRDRTQEDTTFGAITHILALFTWVVGPLIVLVATEDEFVKENARNALNWQIMFSIYLFISFVLVFLLIGIVFLLIIPLLDLAFCIIAAVKASDGEAWEYPITIDFV